MWAVLLDGRPIKTMYKDSLKLPSRALAVAIAEEWENQQDEVDIRSLYLNNMLAKCVRTMHDAPLSTYMLDEL